MLKGLRRFALDLEFVLLGALVILVQIVQVWIFLSIGALARVSASIALASRTKWILSFFILKYAVVLFLTLVLLQQIKRRFALPKFLVAMAALGYALLFCLVYYPYLLEDYSPPRSLMVAWGGVASHFYVQGVLLVSVLLLLYRVRWAPKLSQAALLVGLLAMIFVNDPYGRLNNLSLASKRKPAPGSILILGIDCLNADALQKLDLNKYPALSRFLKGAQNFPKVETNLARTFPAYISVLSGKSILQTGIRGSLFGSDRTTDEILTASTASRMRKKGYDISVMLNDYSFAYFTKGDVIGRVEGPPQGVHNNILEISFRDPFFFGLFNNVIGKIFFPEIIKNGALAGTYFWQYFYPEAIGELNRQDSNGPFLKIAHIVALHWPYANAYPYYHVYPRSESADSVFAMDSVRKFYRPKRFVRPQDAEADQKIYQDSVVRVVETYLEPLLSYLEDETYKDLTVVLMSDHGETVTTTESVPRPRVNHGDWVGFNDLSTHNFLAIRRPEAAPLIPIHTLSELLPTLMAERSEDTTQFTFSESDRNILRSLPGQLEYANAIEVGAYTSNADGYMAQTDEVNNNDIALKTRKVTLRNGTAMTVFPSRFGYRLFFDGAKETAEKSQLVSTFNRIYESDIHGQLVPELKLGNSAQDYAEFSPVGLLPKMIHGLELVYRLGEYSQASTVFKELLAAKTSTMTVRSVATIELARLCTLRVVDSKEVVNLTENFVTEMPGKLKESAANNVHSALDRCLKSNGQTEYKTRLLLDQFEDAPEFRHNYSYYSDHPEEFFAPLTAMETTMQKMAVARDIPECASWSKEAMTILKGVKNWSRWNFAGMGDAVATLLTNYSTRKRCTREWSEVVRKERPLDLISQPEFKIISELK